MKTLSHFIAESDAIQRKDTISQIISFLRTNESLDSETLDNILHMVNPNSGDVDSLINGVISNTAWKSKREEISDQVYASLRRSKMRSTDQERILNAIHKDELVLHDRILKSGKTMNFMEIINPVYADLLENLAPLLVNITTKPGKTGVGRGEFALPFMSPSIIKSDRGGDLIINGIRVELKSGGRFSGYETHTPDSSIRKEFYDQLSKLDGFHLSTHHNYSPNNKGIKQINDIVKNNFAEVSDRVKFIKKLISIICKIYSRAHDSSIVTRFIANNKYISTDGLINTDTFIKEFCYMQYEYYENVDHFKGVLFITDATHGAMKLRYVENLADFKKSIEGKALRIKASFNWGFVKSNHTYQVYLN